MNYGNIKNCDIANGEGVRITLFVSGCNNRCEGCFQPETWDFNYGKPFTNDVISHIIKLLEPDYINGLTVLGGEPLEPANQEAVYELLKRVKERYSNKSIWLFTGFIFENLYDKSYYAYTEYIERILNMVDILVDGPFELSKKNLALKFRGSENQRIIDLDATRKEKKPVLWDGGIV